MFIIPQAVILQKVYSMNKIVINLLFAVIMGMCMASCKKKIIMQSNDIYVYAPSNTVDVVGISQTREGKIIPIHEVISDNSVHRIMSSVITYEDGSEEFPNADTRFQFTASTENEYYLLIDYAVYVNGEKIDILELDKQYDLNVVFQAIKEQQPYRIVCISTSETQYINGAYRFPRKMQGYMEITIP